MCGLGPHPPKMYELFKQHLGGLHLVERLQEDSDVLTSNRAGQGRAGFFFFFFYFNQTGPKSIFKSIIQYLYGFWASVITSLVATVGL